MTDEREIKPTGILSGLLSLEAAPSEQSQALWADIRRAEIEQRYRKSDAFGTGYSRRRTDLLKVAFALKRGIALSKSDWEISVIYRAAFEHPELDPNRKSRGRPSKSLHNKGLLGGYVPADPEADEMLEAIDKWRFAYRDKTGKKTAPSVRKVLEFLVHKQGIWPEGHQNNFSLVRAWENRISEARGARKAKLSQFNR